MRVGLVCAYSLDVPGGVQHHVLELADALVGQGSQVSVLAPATAVDGLPGYVVPAGRAVAVPYNGSVARLAFGPRAASKVRRWLAAGDFDVVHVHEPTAPSLSLIATWAAQVPVVATFHASMPQSAKAMAVVGGLLRPVLARIDARIAVSQHALATMQRHLGGTGAVLPNGLWVARFARAEPNPAWVSEAGTVAFLGRTDEPRKGLDVLVEAWAGVIAQRPAMRLLIAGHGDSARVCDQLHARLGPQAARSVDVLGWLDDEQRAQLLSSADVFAAPHTGGESFGLVLVEAMAAGAAVVASDLPAFADVLGDGRLGRLFPAGDSQALTTALVDVLDDPIGRERVARRAATALGAYDWPVVATQVLEVYRDVLAAADGGRRRGPTHPGDGRTMGDGPTPPNAREATSRD